MTKPRRKISQREALRNRRDLRRLRQFVQGIEGAWPSGADATHIETISANIPAAYAKMRGAVWGAGGHVVFVARIESTSVTINAVRTPTTPSDD